MQTKFYNFAYIYFTLTSVNNFDFEIIKKMTIMNSHGDYSVQQLIYNDNSKTTVIDFETAKKLPIIWEVFLKI